MQKSELKTAMLLNLKGESNLGRVVTCIISRCSDTPELNLSIWEVLVNEGEEQIFAGLLGRSLSHHLIGRKHKLALWEERIALGKM